MGYGVIGNTTDSGSVILGSSPGTPADLLLSADLLPPSFSGLGHRPLTAAAPVRIRLGVRGSGCRFRRSDCHMPPSFSGLGHRPLTAAAPVRIRLGVRGSGCRFRRSDCHMPPSFSGLGHRPLTAAAPVRIRLGVRGSGACVTAQWSRHLCCVFPLLRHVRVMVMASAAGPARVARGPGSFVRRAPAGHFPSSRQALAPAASARLLPRR